MNIKCRSYSNISRLNRKTQLGLDKTNSNMGNSMPTTYEPNGALNQSRTSTLGGRSTKSRKTESTRPESSRVLFLLYLIHRTWNVMVDTVDSKNKRYVLAQLTRRWRINIQLKWLQYYYFYCNWLARTCSL